MIESFQGVEGFPRSDFETTSNHFNYKQAKEVKV